MEIYEITTAKGVVECYECNGTYFCLHEEDEQNFNKETILDIELVI